MGPDHAGYASPRLRPHFPAGTEVYTDMEQWADIRRRVLQEGVSKRQILRETRMHWTTLEKILTHSAPPDTG